MKCYEYDPKNFCIPYTKNTTIAYTLPLIPYHSPYPSPISQGESFESEV